jgi:hypothetical protein
MSLIRQRRAVLGLLFLAAPALAQAPIRLPADDSVLGGKPHGYLRHRQG